MPRPAPRAWTARFTVAASHPCLPGHFPGAPLVPGVLLLDHVFQAIRAAGHAAPGRLLRAKFTAPVQPGQTVILALRDSGTGRIAFQGHREDATPVLSGEVALPPPPISQPAVSQTPVSQTAVSPPPVFPPAISPPDPGA